MWGPSRTTFVLLLVAAIALLAMILGHETEGLSNEQRNSPVSGTTQDRGAGKKSVPVKSGDAPPRMPGSSATVARQFEQVILAGAGIDRFILQQLALAESGNANSAHYVSEAMDYCAMNLLQLQISFDVYNTQGDQSRPDANAMAKVVMDGLVGLPEFYLAQARKHLERSVACATLGWNSDYLFEKAASWAQTAVDRKQPIAMAEAAQLGPSQPYTAISEPSPTEACIRPCLACRPPCVFSFSHDCYPRTRLFAARTPGSASCVWFTHCSKGLSGR